MTRRDLSHRSHQSGSSTSSSCSDVSTAPSMLSKRSLVKYHCEHSGPYYDRLADFKESFAYGDYGESCSSIGSVHTYASTAPSQADLTLHPKFEVPLTTHDVYPSDAIPSSPTDFAKFFPSNRRLFIHHDDATSDGNMNLRVDTEVIDPNGRAGKLTLFHLRMYDLKDRCFSLRRYCRDSGREICNSNRKYALAPPFTSARSNIQQSLGHTLHQLRLKHEDSVSTRTGAVGQGRDYGTIEDALSSRFPIGPLVSTPAQSSTNFVQLEFSNYARIAMHKRGLKRSKRYEYEFWGTKYEWKRQIYRDGSFEEVSYHLISNKTTKSIAHITPDPLTAREAQEEEECGGWVPPCTMQIIDRSVFRSLTDVADTIVATGLLALVDDCIDRRWHNKRNFHLALPIREATDYHGPGHLVDQVFNRQVHIPAHSS